MIEIKWKRLNPEAKQPVKIYKASAGWDVHAAEYVSLQPFFGQVEAKTGIAMAIPDGHCIFAKDRSGLARRGLHVAAGVFDADFRGEVIIVLRNSSSEYIKFHPGDRIAQLLILPVPEVKWVEVDSLDETDRGTNGFGSTGR
jgi:dUTP pyrophosphatase